MLSLKEKLYLCDLECRVKWAQQELFDAESAYDAGQVSLQYYADARDKYKRANDDYIEAARRLIRHK